MCQDIYKIYDDRQHFGIQVIMHIFFQITHIVGIHNLGIFQIATQVHSLPFKLQI